MHGSFDIQFLVVELRVSADAQLGTLGNRLQGVVTGELVIEGKIGHMDPGIHDRLLRRSRALGNEIHPALDGHTAGLEHGKAGQVKITSVKREAKAVCGKIISSTSRNLRLAVCQMNLVQQELLPVECKPGPSLLHGLITDGCIPELKRALPCGRSPSSRGLQ